MVRMAYDTKCKTKDVKVQILWCTAQQFLDALGRLRTATAGKKSRSLNQAANRAIDKVPVLVTVDHLVRNAMKDIDGPNKTLTAHGLRAIYCAMAYEDFFHGQRRDTRPKYDTFVTRVLGHSTATCSGYYNKLLDSRSRIIIGVCGDEGVEHTLAELRTRVAELESANEAHEPKRARVEDTTADSDDVAAASTS